MRLHRSLPALSALALLSGPSLAQTGFDAQLVPSGLASTVLGGSSSTLGRLFPADLDGNGRQDLILREDDQAIWVIDPGFYDANIEITPTTDSLTGGAVAPPASGSSQDRFIAADANGLRSFTWNAVTWSFDVLNLTPVPGDWASAKRLQVGEDALGKPFVLGYSANNDRRIMLLLDIDGAKTTVRINLPAQPSVDVLQDVAVLDFDGIAGDEVFVSTMRKVYRLAPVFGATLVTEKSFNSDASHLQPLHRNGAPDQLVAAFHPVGALRDRLFVVDSAHGVSTNLLLDVNKRIVEMASGDLDADGTSDLAVAFDVVTDLTYFQNNGNVAGTNWQVPFGYQAGEWRDFDLVPLGASTTDANFAEPVILDADGDGDNDLMFPLQSGRSVAFLRNAEIDHTAEAPAFHGLPPVPGFGGDPGAEFVDRDSGLDDLELFVEPGSVPLDDLEWSLWYLPNANYNAEEKRFVGDLVAASQDFGSVDTTAWSTKGIIAVQLEHDPAATEMFFIEGRGVGTSPDVDPTVAFAFSLNFPAQDALGMVFTDIIDGRPVMASSDTSGIGGGGSGSGGGQGDADPVLIPIPDTENPDVGVVTLIPRLPKFPPGVVPNSKSVTLGS